MKNWKFDLFNFKQGLTLEQLEISSVVERHLQVFDRFSEKELTYSLKEGLKNYSYDESVKGLFESMDEEIENNSLVYDLKDLYKKVERKDFGLLYREPLSKILDAINKDTDEERMTSVLNDVSLYDWVPEIKGFVEKLTTNPMDLKNLKSGNAKASKVYTIVEQIENGTYVAFVGNRWFKFTDNEVKEADLTESFAGEDLSRLYNLQKALEISDFENEKVVFNIDENLQLSLGVNGKVYLNEEEVDKQSSLEDLFNSPIIPMLKKNYYHVVKQTMESLDKFVELDVNQKVSNITKPLSELYVFNYKDKLYLYNVDKRTGSSFYEYDSVNQLVEDVQRSMGYDISDFVSNKLSKELKQYKKLEDKEQEIQGKIKEVQESLEALEEEKELLNESADLKAAFDNLITYKEELTNNLRRIQNAKVAERKRIG